ncbi:hypothetical protein M569_04022 [Genlisea aurea]|uniref:Pentatricopeptide repeat-containing protein n=1 Tax=Genlisea aurea TaxID=192259 RepID=S8EDT5_9LAMI|nr:hypothetical protein M569_04022 [Genlisea aurea]
MVYVLQCKYEDYGLRRNARVSNSQKGTHGSREVRLNLKGHLPAYSSSLLYYACHGPSCKALEIWQNMLSSFIAVDTCLVVRLIFIYGNMQQDFDMVSRILHDMQAKDAESLPGIYALAVSSFGEIGDLKCMEYMVKKMVSMGYCVDSATGNAYLMYYGSFGSITEMERIYGRLKRSRIVIEEEAIRAVSLAYIKESKFYSLCGFVHDLGVGRSDVGNLLWNLLLLCYAARFKMKSLQREFVRMIEWGFKPDIDTFNIRSIAFSRMSLLWDLEVSLEQMKHDGVVGDLVTYGCVIDAYMDRKLGGNLEFGLRGLDWSDGVRVWTDPMVFEAMGKGEFHSSSEKLMEYWKEGGWSYRKLIHVYLRKKSRSDHIFWNY